MIQPNKRPGPVAVNTEQLYASLTQEDPEMSATPVGRVLGTSVGSTSNVVAMSMSPAHEVALERMGTMDRIIFEANSFNEKDVKPTKHSRKIPPGAQNAFFQ